MNELSLFTGAGGGLLGTKYFLGWRTIGYVECEDYPQRIIAARIRDGLLDEAPIFGDVRTFISEGYARRYRGVVDVITAGFPCQPFSIAGKQAAADDPRNMWPATIECIREVRPQYCLLENVPGLLAASHGYFGEILKELAESGYDAKWRVLSAAELGAPHKRDRLWIACANTESSGLERTESARDTCPNGCTTELRDKMADTSSKRETWWRNGRLSDIAETERQRTDNRAGTQIDVCWEWWKIEPNVGRVADGVASRVDRLKAIGNGQVPAVAAAAWHLLK